MFRRFAFMPIALLLLAPLYALVVSPASAANDSVVKMSLQEWKVDISSTTVQVGSPVRFEIANKGVIAHEVVIEKSGAVNKALELNGGKAIVENITPGGTQTLTWTFSEPGTYWAACHLPGHFEAGMKIAFTVVAAPDNVPSTTTNAPSTTTNAPAPTTNATTTNAPATGDAAAPAPAKTSGQNSRLFELDQRLYPPDNIAAAESAQHNQQLLWLDMMLYP